MRRKELFGEFLLRKGYITRQILDEALSNQIVFGGRLGTNLIDMGAITERALAKALAEYHGVPTVKLEDLRKIQPSALKLLSRKFVERSGVIPIREEGNYVLAITLDPSNLKAIDEAEFKLGKRIKPLVVPEVTFKMLLERLYGIKREARFVTLSMMETHKVYRKKGGVEGKKEEEYTSPPEEVEALEIPPELKEKIEREDEVLLTEMVEDEAGGEHTEAEEIVLTEEALAPKEPIPESEAREILLSASSREDIAFAVLSYSLNFFARCALFTVKKGFVMGWDAAGPDELRGKIKSAVFTADERSTFGFVVTTRSHYLGPLFKSPIDELFLNMLGGDAPLTSFLIPVIFRGKVVNILYGDGGPGRPAGAEVSDLILFLQELNKIYERVLERRKRFFRGTV